MFTNRFEDFVNGPLVLLGGQPNNEVLQYSSNYVGDEDNNEPKLSAENINNTSITYSIKWNPELLEVFA